MFAAAEDVPGAAVDPTAVDLLSWTAKIGYWTARTIGIAVHYTYYYASFVLFSILKLIYEPLSFILAPVFYLAQFTSNCFLAPFRFLAKFEVPSFHIPSNRLPAYAAIDSVYLPCNRCLDWLSRRIDSQLHLQSFANAPRIRYKSSACRSNGKAVPKDKVQAKGQNPLAAFPFACLS